MNEQPDNKTRLAEIEAELEALEAEKARLLPWPQKRGKVFMAEPTNKDWAHGYTYCDDATDHLLLARKLLFRTREEAVAAAKTMAKVLGWEE